MPKINLETRVKRKTQKYLNRRKGRAEIDILACFFLNKEPW